MRLIVHVELSGDPPEPNHAAADALTALAKQMRLEAPHDFLDASAVTDEATARSEWWA